MGFFYFAAVLIGVFQFCTAFRNGMGEWKLLAGLVCLIEFGLGLEMARVGEWMTSGKYELICAGAAAGYLFGDSCGAVLGTCFGNKGYSTTSLAYRFGYWMASRKNSSQKPGDINQRD